MTKYPVRIYGLTMNTGDLRARALDILSAALDAAHPHQLMTEALDLHGTILDIEGLGGQQTRLDLNDFERIVAVGAGKATAPMAGALEDLLQARLESGVISVKYGHTALLDRIEVRESGHPVPDLNGISATREILSMLFSLGSRDLAFVLLSGGGSALLDAYPEPITLDDAQATFGVLLNSGAPIHEINVVRKHISSVKGGQLARLAQPATVITLVLSDVIGDPLDIIASGPTVPDPSSFDDALAILDAYNVRDRIPQPVMDHLERGGEGRDTGDSQGG
ncbi:glycerate-2-kinase family protein [Gemmatimonadota bacterium]